MKNRKSHAALRAGRALVACSLALVAPACSDALDVENPNNLVEEDLSKPASAGPAVNGASATLARGLGAMLGPYSAATDEVVWIGSRDAWRELDQGFLANERNEFSDDAFRYYSQGRFMTDEAIQRLEGFDAQKQLTDRGLLAQAYLYGAIAYTTTADMFETFVISDRREAGKPIPPAEMAKLYDKALEYITKGLAIPQANATTRNALLGMRARTEFSKGLWAKINPKGQVAGDPLVNSAAASAAAAAALASMPADFRFVMKLANDDLALAGEVSLAYSVNQRGELDLAPAYGKLGKSAGATLEDPIAKIPDPVLDREIKAFGAAYINQPITIVSAREMLLILAEAALAAGNLPEFTAQINRIRALDRLTPFSGQIPAAELLQHTRRVNLFLQGRRLADQYRFRVASPQWVAGSTAVTKPGTLFPVTCTEIRAHPEDFPNVAC